MLLALLSDTHDNIPSIQAALTLLQPHHPVAYLHAGDLVDEKHWRAIRTRDRAQQRALLCGDQVGVDQRVRIDLKLEVGAMTESVTIEATASLVQTSSLELSTTVDDEQIEALPLNGRNFAPHRSTTQWGCSRSQSWGARGRLPVGRERIA